MSYIQSFTTWVPFVKRVLFAFTIWGAFVLSVLRTFLQPTFIRTMVFFLFFIWVLEYVYII